MATSSDMPDTTRETPRLPRRLALGLLTILAIAAVLAIGFLFGYTKKSTEPVEASAAKTDFATAFSAPKCDDGERSFTLKVNEIVQSNGAPLSTKGAFDSTTGLAGDILVSSEARDGLPAVKMTKVYAWEPQSLSSTRAGWLVTRYIVPGPTTLLLIKGSNLSASGRLVTCYTK